MQWRQGDVLIESVDSIPDGAEIQKRNGRIVLAYGEVTGHAHAIHEQEVEELKFNADVFLRVLRDKAKVVHEEHSPITLPKGNYRVIRQKEYSPAAIRNVQD